MSRFELMVLPAGFYFEHKGDVKYFIKSHGWTQIDKFKRTEKFVKFSLEIQDNTIDYTQIICDIEAIFKYIIKTMFEGHNSGDYFTLSVERKDFSLVNIDQPDKISNFDINLLLSMITEELSFGVRLFIKDSIFTIRANITEVPRRCLC